MGRENEYAGLSFVYHKNHKNYKTSCISDDADAHDWFKKNKDKVTKAPCYGNYRFKAERAKQEKRNAVLKKIHIVKGDITELTNVQAIVNSANKSLLIGGGVDEAIHQAAGPELLEECRTLNGCERGGAKITKAYNLSCNYVIHTVGPVWRGGTHQEEQLLSTCYRNSLQLAVSYGIRTIAFPSISTGAYGYPAEKAAKVALNTVYRFLQDHYEQIDEVYLVLFDNRTLIVYKEELKKLKDTSF